MKLRIFLFCYFLWASLLFSQSHSDCQYAVLLKDSVMTIPSVNGPGLELEIKGHELGNTKYFTEEHNTIWIKIIPQVKGELTLEIIPDKPSDDWDFMLFKASVSECADITSMKIEPVRSNLARNDTETKGVTGLSALAKLNFEPAGIHPNFCKPIDVEVNADYLLVVDINQFNGNGFKLRTMIEPGFTEIVTEHNLDDASGFEFVDMSEEVVETKSVGIKFVLIQKETDKPINCNAEIVGVQWDSESKAFKDVNEFTVDVPADMWFYVNVKKDGYTFASDKFKATNELMAYPQKIYISEVKKGSHIVLTEIVFRENTTHLLPTSVNALDQLINFMKEYPTAKVEIQGHVNAPGYDNDGKVKKFSLKRAEQIKVYLTDAGIEGSRIQVRGMGNEYMIYPTPKSYDEEKANRRVEIEILSL